MGGTLGVLFVCLGNICRSPTAHGVFRHLATERGLADRLVIDSAGTEDYHPGKAPDPRSQKAASRRGYHLGDLRARVVVARDFAEFDYILAMDESNHADLLARCPVAHRGKVGMFLAYAPGLGTTAVPDPYFGGGDGFERVLDLIEEASAGLLAHLEQELDRR